LENLEELANSIKQHGLIQPLVVRPTKEGYEVIAGNRRLEAARLLKMRRIACYMVELSDREAYEIAIAENVQHHSLNAVEEALAFKRYAETQGWGGISELSRRIGKSQEFVTKRIQLLRLPERIQREIIRQRITPSAAIEMLPLGKQEVEALAEVLSHESLTRDEIRQMVKISRDIQEKGPDEGANEQNFSVYHKEIFLIDRALRKSIAVMKSTLVNFDDILNNIGDDWVIRELLMQYRLIIHGDIDTFVKLRKRLGMKMPRGYFDHDHEVKRVVKMDTANSSDSIIHLWSTRGIWQ
jgi:ParB family chromosome partitioning protein